MLGDDITKEDGNLLGYTSNAFTLRDPIDCSTDEDEPIEVCIELSFLITLKILTSSFT